MKNKTLFLIVALMSLVLSACSSQAPAATPEDVAAPVEAAAPAPVIKQIPEIKIDAADFSYTSFDTIGAGWVRVTLKNSGIEPHHVQFLRLNDGVTYEQFLEAVQQGEGPALALTAQVGGVGAVAPGGSADAILDLPAGEYVILCFIPSPSDHVPHLAKGMISQIRVVPASETASEEPEATLVVRMKDFMFDLPDTLPAGRTTIQVVNDGPEPHELNFLRLADGKTVQDVVQYLNAPDGPPPFTPVGGMNGLDVGKKGYLEFNFQPGNYVAICNIPSPAAQGSPHFALGMMQGFSVTLDTARFPTGKFASAENEHVGFYFNADKTWAYFSYGEHPVGGSYQVEGNLYTELTNSDDECPFPASYAWEYDGFKLTFQLVGEDQCTPRQEAIDGQTFVMSN